MLPPKYDKPTKRCSVCKEDKPVSAFGTKKGRRDHMVYLSACNACRVVRENLANKRDPVKHRAKCKRTNMRLKLTVFNHYGRYCACCGETDIRFLSIDHEEGNGAEHRELTKCGSGTTFYAWLIRNGFPPGYKTLCCNCNLAKGRNGACPHEEFDVMTMVGACG